MKRLSKQELYDIVIVLVEYNKVNPRKRWSDLAEKIMSIIDVKLIHDTQTGDCLTFDHEDETREFV